MHIDDDFLDSPNEFMILKIDTGALPSSSYEHYLSQSLTEENSLLRNYIGDRP